MAAVLGAVAAMIGCTQPSVGGPARRAWTNSRVQAAATEGATAAPPARGGCELVERAGECRLESASAVEDATGDREVVAVYAVTDADAPLRIERRYRVAYLARGEDSHMEHLRAHPVVACRWQTVVRGACEPYAGSADAPEVPGEERRHHGRRHAHVLAERSVHGPHRHHKRAR